MKIEIDTKRDSKDEIKKVIKMLQHLVEDDAYFEAGNSAQSMQQSSGGPFGSGDSSASGSSSYSSNEMPGLGFLGDDAVESGSSSSFPSSSVSSEQSSTRDDGSENPDDLDIDSFETY